MSATIESEMFAGYYSSVVGNRLVPAPVINVEGKIYPVVEFYSDDMMFLGEVCFINHLFSIVIIIIMDNHARYLPKSMKNLMLMTLGYSSVGKSFVILTWLRLATHGLNCLVWLVGQLDVHSLLSLQR